MNQSVACYSVEDLQESLQDNLQESHQENSQKDEQELFDDVIDGLTATPKTLPCKYFYDEYGSQLFEKICELDEYYITRTELSMLKQYAPEMAELIGEDAVVIEPGSGAGEKIQILLDNLQNPQAYIPIEISKEILQRSANIIEEKYSGLQVFPVESDFTQSLENFSKAIKGQQISDNHCLFFPGSTLGNFSPLQAIDLLKTFSAIVGKQGSLLLGVDRLKSIEVIEAAYNDKQGVTAEFNKNILQRINRELGADFDLENFEHISIFNAQESRIEMHLTSCEDQTVTIANRSVGFTQGETIHTENSYKYSDAVFKQLVEESGLSIKKQWLDENELFSIYLLVHAS